MPEVVCDCSLCEPGSFCDNCDDKFPDAVLTEYNGLDYCAPCLAEIKAA